MKKLFLLFLPFFGGCADLGNLATLASDYYGGYAQGYSSYQQANPSSSGTIMYPDGGVGFYNSYGGITTIMPPVGSGLGSTTIYSH